MVDKVHNEVGLFSLLSVDDLLKTVDFEENLDEGKFEIGKW